MKHYKKTILFVAMIISFSYSVHSQNNEKKKTTEALVELEVKKITMYDGSSYLIELTKKGEKVNWVFPMVIGECEANSINRSTYKIVTPRPMTYDLINNLFEKTSLKLKQIVITKLSEGTFYAILIIDDNGKTIEIDARPSDCINIALKASIPIYATQVVLDDAKEVRIN